MNELTVVRDPARRSRAAELLRASGDPELAADARKLVRIARAIEGGGTYEQDRAAVRVVFRAGEG